MKNKLSIAMTLALILAMLVTSLALADNLQGDDLTAGGNATKYPGQGGTAAFWLVANGNDGCNADSDYPVSITISSNQTWLTVDSSASITDCGQANTVTVSYSVASNAPVGGVATVQGIASGGKPDNNGFNNNPGDFTVTVVASPNTSPTLNLPGNITAEATSAAGAVVTYSVSATDAEDNPDPTPSCSPTSGSTFALGTTTVSCSVTDLGGLSVSGSFTVTVQDTTPPSLSLPSDITAEATGSSGAVVSYSASANDLVDGAVAVSCSPASGFAFAIGTTSVTCSATDAHNNTGTTSFNVTVQDTTPPVVTVPSDITAEATGPSGAAVSFSASASDLVDGSLTPTCTPVSGSTFALGTTLVTCSATDAHGNTGSASFNVIVQDTTPPALISCDSPDGIWHANDVTLYCYYTDLVSGSSQVALSTSVTGGIETNNASASAGSAKACDAASNCADSPADISGNMVDKKAPQQTSCDSPDGIWHADNVTLYCHYTDGGSGPATQDIALSTNIAAGTETDNAVASAGGAKACDSVDNCATSPADIGGNKVDKKAPTIMITVPDAGPYLLNQPISANYGCNDDGSGIASCVGTVANGSNIDTASVGAKSFTVNATDNVGNVASAASVTYNVQYATGGMCYGGPGHQILQPINSDGSSVFKQKSTVPAKFRVCDAAGNSVGTPGVVASFKLLKTISGTNESTVNEPVDSTTPDTAFRWSATDQQWIFNINTKNLSVGKTYVYLITLNDGSTIQFQFGLK